MNSTDSIKNLLATSGGDTVKLFDLSLEPRDPCILSYIPSPGFQVNSLKWNHTNLVVASAGDDKKISLWRKNGQSLGTVPMAGNDGGDNIEESISTINFSSKASRYICSGGSGQVVRIWDLQRKRCIKWLKGHTDTISGVMYNCKDEHLASISLNGSLILHNLASGAKAAELKDPNGQVLRVLDYSKISRHLLVTAGDDGSIHLWDTTGRSPKAVISLCWQRAKPVIVNENNCTTEMALLGSAVEDSILMPDPLPTMVSSSLTSSMTTSGSRTTVRSGSVDSFSFPAGITGSTSGTLGVSPSEETPIRSSLWKGGSLARLHAPRNFKDDMEVFSPLVEVQPITPSLDKLWDDQEGFKKDFDKKSSLLLPSSLRFPLSVEGGNENRPIFDWKSSPLPKQDDASSAQLSSTSVSSHDSSSITPPEAWGGERLSDRLSHLRQSGNMPSRFAISTSGPLAQGTMLSGLQDTFPATQSISSLTSSSLSLANLRIKENSNEETSLGSSEHFPSSSTSFSVGTKGVTGQGTLDSTMSLPRRFSSYAERISTAPYFSDGTLSVGSPKIKKTGAETREELLNSLLSRSDTSSATAAGAFQAMNGEIKQSQKSTVPELQQGSSFTLQLFQRTQEETLSSLQKSIHEDMRNLHLDILRQFHMQEMETSNAMKLILENQAELMKEVQLLRRETQQLRQLL
ncbi:protein NEDD1 isoform X2 [Lycium barbarum]|uniref:protein NEDD1 isoform X2 n=1 Tax=Lycium barbarum TaxID=112863 RepID=UPI00293F1246|nr:protein NEDD1 isoform X2 [Lycium barbarum]